MVNEKKFWTQRYTDLFKSEKLHLTVTVAINFVVLHASKPKKAKQNAVKQSDKGMRLYFNESKYFKYLCFQNKGKKIPEIYNLCRQ